MKRLILLTFLMFGITGLTAQEKAPTNKHFWYSLETHASPERIWSVWTNVPDWKTWDIGLKDASIEDEFNLGAKGKIVSLEERTTKFKVVEYIKGVSYTYKTKLPLGSLYVKRYLTKEKGKTSFTHEVWFKGLTGGLFAKAFGAKFREMLPTVLSNVKTLAEADDSH